MSKKPYYITTAITYTSGKPHIGNTYEIILADSIARFKRMQGYDVHFQTGTDEHGQKIETKAQEAGVSPKEYVDKVAGEIKRIWDLMNTSYDRFIRTTDEDHERQVQKIFRKLHDQGDIYKGVYKGKYCTPCESFWTESQLVNGRCPDCGSKVIDAEEPAYFFKLSKYQDQLMDYINEHPDFIQPASRRNEMINNFLKPGLQDLCVSRSSFKWGIPVDFDPDHVVYVWIDALSNYITGLGYDVDGNSSELYKKYWPADLHLIGKDIIRFHTIYWPIMLMALGEPLPKQVFGHPWLLVGEGKMSKSKGNVIYADDLVRYFGVDAVRYFVLHEMPFESDGSISWDLMVERMNSDLANILGNLVNRTIAMTNKYLGGEVSNPGVSEPVDDELKAMIEALPAKLDEKMDKLRVSDAISEIFLLLRRCNKYIDETEPWKLGKDESQKERLKTVLYNLLEGIRVSAICLGAFLPETSEKILDMIGTQQRDYLALGSFGGLETGIRVTEKPQILFARVDIKELTKQMENDPAMQQIVTDKKGVKKVKKDNASAGASEGGIDIEPKPEITIEDFDKLQFQVGEIIKCEAVPKSKKLLCSQVKIGSQVRQIVSGIRKHYSPEEMVGKKVMVVTNLKPAKLAGILSEGMILCAEDEKGELAVMVPDKSMPDGAEIC